METKTPAKPKQPGGGWKKRLVFAAVVSAALTFTLCLFGPLDLFFNNYEEIWFHFQDIIGGIAVVAGLFFLLTTLVGTLLRGKLHDLYMALMFGGLLGTAPIMPISTKSPAKFIHRGGRIPAPIQSLKN